ncbi:MAG: peptidoglycan DD-metalloendopeptidase family protein [Anaerolineae bacterium]|nr:peptidoglycan DD-metalloendopeptidase family protein [Anaerolineae bacterium]
MTDPESRPNIPEPPIEAGDTPPSGLRRFREQDTQPTQAIHVPKQSGGGIVQVLLYGLALVITAVAAILYLQPNQPPAVPTTEPTQAADVGQPLPSPTTVPVEATAAPPTETSAPVDTSAPLPSDDVPVDVVAELLLQNGDTTPPTDALYRQQSAYTVAPVRPRSTWMSYTVRVGDTLEEIAKRFGITVDTLVGSNDIVYVNRLFPGDELTVLPEDGVLHKANGQETIQQIADKYKVAPVRIIDSEYNPKLGGAGATPSTILPPEMLVMVPGGVVEKKLLFWSPPIKVEQGSSGAASGFVTFGVGQEGSCGRVGAGAGTGSFALPLPVGTYNVTRGFSASHGGIDLAGRAGTTVFAADSGNVLYAGWVNYGYGNVVVISHGDKWTIYGHLSAISVSCGASVGKGAVIGATGSTGNSSGPHLHFEVRIFNGSEWVPVNPTGYRGF